MRKRMIPTRFAPAGAKRPPLFKGWLTTHVLTRTSNLSQATNLRIRGPAAFGDRRELDLVPIQLRGPHQSRQILAGQSRHARLDAVLRLPRLSLADGGGGQYR